MKLKKTLAAGVIALALAAVGCGGQAAAPSGDASTGGATTADAPAWPESGKPVTIIVAFAPGGAVDTGARTIAPKLEEALGTNVIVENKPGAGGQIGYTALTSAKPDGYTIGATGSPSVVVSPLDPSRGATYTRESFEPLGRQVVDPSIIGVSPDSPYQTLDELLEAAKANPNTITVSTTGLQTGEHFTAVEIQKQTGAQFALVHFSDGAAKAVAAFLGGHVDVYIGSASDVTDMVKQGTINVLGVASHDRSEALPDAPTFEEQGYEIIFETSRGYSAPAGLPENVKATLEAALDKAINDPEVVSKMKDLGLYTVYLNAADYEADWAAQEETMKELLPEVMEAG